MGSKRIEARLEYDAVGPIQIPANCYWGAQTARAKEQLLMVGWKVQPKLLDAIVLVKKAAALVNADLGRLEGQLATAIAQAADEVLAGQWKEQFVAEPLQSGSGLTLITNVNEVLANRAEELLGGNVGEYKIIDPHRHLNIGQSTNDVFSTAMRLALLQALKELEPVLLDLERLLRRKALEFAKIVKVGRAHLQDSVPITLGQEFNAFGSTVERCYKHLKESGNCLFEINIGGTFIGTGWDAHPAYQGRMVEKLSTLSKLRLKPGEDLVRMSQSMVDFMQISSALREMALELNKIANDLRLLNSGPLASLAEIKLPAVAPYPSPLLPDVLPAGVEPLLAESVNMVCFQIIGLDLATAFACQAGQLETNAMAAVIVQNLLSSFDLLKQVLIAFGQKCLSGISANGERALQYFVLSGGLFAALCEQIGVEDAKLLLKKYGGNHEQLRQALHDGGILPQPVVEKILSHAYLTAPGLRPRAGDVMESAS